MDKSLTAQFVTGRAAVLMPVAVDRAFDYALPPGLSLAVGSFVTAPFHGKPDAVGVVWGPPQGGVAEGRIKPVRAALDVPPLPLELHEFVDWVAHYTMMPLGMVLRMVLSAPAALGDLPQRVLYRLPAYTSPSWEGEGVPLPRIAHTLPRPPSAADLSHEGEMNAQGLSPKRQAVIEVLADGHALTLGELAREAAVGQGVIRAMAARGLIEPVTARRRAGSAVRLDPRHAAPSLTDSQRAAATSLREAVRKDAFGVTLLDGVTGSGKTEVYFEAVAEALQQGRQALVLLPEIALSAQFVERFRPRFGGTPALWHSDLTPAQRRDTWRGVADGEVRVVIGARSALFLPFPELGLIVVDEENDQSFKQEEGVIYQARDMAVVRAKLGGFPIALVSATPSLETMVNVEAGRYRHVTLPARFGGAALPRIALLDLRQNKLPRGRFLSDALAGAVRETLDAGEQALLFLNRRGYAPLTLCRACGFRLKCPNCTAWLVEHRAQDRLVCHYCAHTERIPERCPSCGIEGNLAAIGPGVERIAEETSALFPEARLALMASDLMAGPGVLAETLRRIGRGEIDIIIGTQIIAKGHHFPKLTLVGVIDADIGLSGGDLRAGERTYQLMQQVAGRAGRAAHPGRALIQTYEPQHPVMQALVSGDRDRFMRVERDERQAAAMPPFTRLAALIVSGEDKSAVEHAAMLLGRAAPQGATLRVLGPAPAPLFMLRGRYRYRLLLRAARNLDIQALIRDWLARTEIQRDVRVQIDIDPYSFL